jgi:hypothetical protein
MKGGNLTVEVHGLRAMDFKRSTELRAGKKTPWSDDRFDVTYLSN